MSGYVMGIDNGGSVTKCAIFDEGGHEVAVATRRIPLVEPRPGWTERDLEEVWQGNVAVINECLKTAGIAPEELKGIGLTGYGNGICMVDAEGRPTTNGIVSSDNRCAEQCVRLQEAGIEEKIYPLTYQELWPAQTAMLLLWYKENMPEVLEKTTWVLAIKDYIRMRLTGEACCEATETTCNGLMNIFTCEFDPVIFETLGLSETMPMMPRLVGTTEVSGRVNDAAAALTGLAPGTPVAGSCYDVNAGALASGILDDETLCIISGTWSINEHLTKELVDGANSIAVSYLPGYYLLEESSPTSASNFQWFVENFLQADRPGVTSAEIYEECNKLVAGLDPAESDVVFVPYLFASSTHPDAKACFLNLTSYHTRAHMIQAIYEGVVFSSMMHIETLADQGKSFEKAKLSGGISKSEVWSQMVCDAIGMPLQVSGASEVTALGAAMCAAICAGTYKDMPDAVAHMVHLDKTYTPNPERTAVYAKKFATYKKAVEALEVFHT